MFINFSKCLDNGDLGVLVINDKFFGQISHLNCQSEDFVRNLKTEDEMNTNKICLSYTVRKDVRGFPDLDSKYQPFVLQCELCFEQI